MKSKLPQIWTCLFLITILSFAARGASFTVTKTADTNDGACDADCSLREEIAAANAVATDDVISFEPSVFASVQIISLTIAGPLQINNNGSLTINGTGVDLLTVRRTGSGKINNVFSITGATATITDLTVSGGISNNNGGGISNVGGTVNLSNSAIVGNTAAGLGGGI